MHLTPCIHPHTVSTVVGYQCFVASGRPNEIRSSIADIYLDYVTISIVAIVNVHGGTQKLAAVHVAVFRSLKNHNSIMLKVRIKYIESE